MNKEKNIYTSPYVNVYTFELGSCVLLDTSLTTGVGSDGFEEGEDILP